MQNEIESMVQRLLGLAADRAWNKINHNCKFILTPIINSEDNFKAQRQLLTKQNDKKIPVTLEEILPLLRNIYNDLYDINLYIYRAGKRSTIIDIRYYSKSLFEEDHRKKISADPPMLHCSVSLPPWLKNDKEKFDINWEHYEGLNPIQMFWTKLKLKTG